MSFRFHFGRPQAMAALLLMFFLGECAVVIGRAPLTESDYRYALCGREMWEKPSPALGYFTTCGNMQGDGTLAYRAAALPLSSYLAALRLHDRITLQGKADAGDTANPTEGSVYDLRHQVAGLPYLLRAPFAAAAALLGAGLWWVSRRLFGNVAGFLALALYCISPAVLNAATTPNNEILAAWGLYATVYTGIGIAHAMQGPRRKWRPRIVLFTLALGLTACAHVLAAVAGLLVATLLMLYIAERQRAQVLPVVGIASAGALLMVFATYAFRLPVFFYVFTAGEARSTLSYGPLLNFVTDRAELPTLAMLAVALFLYVAVRRSRYFGNSVPLLVAVVLLPVTTTQVHTDMVLWALPFLLTFLAGVVADALETRSRPIFLLLCGTAIVAQGVFTFFAARGMHL